MVTKKLRKITQEEFDKALQDHFLYQKGGNSSKKMVLQNRDFSDVKIMKSDLSFTDFEGSDFSKLDGYDAGIYSHHVYDTIFAGANCRGVNFGAIDIGKSLSLKDTILVDAIFDSRKLTDKQKSEAIFTEEQYKDFLEKQSEKAKKQEIVINKQTKDIKEKNETLKKTSEKQSKGMLDIFDELRVKFLKEEILWLIFGFFIFLSIFSIAETLIASINTGLATIVLFGFFGGIGFVGLVLSWWDKTELNNKTDKWSLKNILASLGESLVIILVSVGGTFLIKSAIQKWDTILCKTSQENSCLSVDKIELTLLPLTLILLSILWFSVHQYGRAKKLRIEQQNKQAMIHFMQAIIANDGKGAPADRSFPQLAPFFANAIIHRPFSQDNYDPQLPIDEVKKVIDMAKIFQK